MAKMYALHGRTPNGVVKVEDYDTQIRAFAEGFGYQTKRVYTVEEGYEWIDKRDRSMPRPPTKLRSKKPCRMARKQAKSVPTLIIPRPKSA